MLLELWGFYSGSCQVLTNVGLEETAILKNISGLERLFLAWFWASNSPRTAMQTGQDVSAKMLLSLGICFRDRIDAELLRDASIIPDCRQRILPRLALVEGSATGKALLC